MAGVLRGGIGSIPTYNGHMQHMRQVYTVQGQLLQLLQALQRIHLCYCQALAREAATVCKPIRVSLRRRLQAVRMLTRSISLPSSRLRAMAQSSALALCVGVSVCGRAC